MKKKNFLFAALTLAALSAGFVSCDDAQNLKDQQKFNVTVVSLDDAMGTVTGSGTYPAGSEIVITATANEGYSFQKWHDGNTDNPRTISVTADATYTAIFAASYDPGQYFYVTVVANNEVMGTVKGEGNYPAGAKINIMATPNTGSYFQQWDDGSTDNPRTITVTGDATYTAIFAANPNGNESGHEWVDLGLSVKWATCNVGATTPESYGDYYAWGETAPKSSYSSDNYSYSDNPAVLPLDRDAARVNWGGAWRMPTDAEWTELRENCEWTWTTRNGVNGREVTSKINGNSIFLPAAGYRYDDDLNDAGSDGGYWSTSLTSGRPGLAWNVGFGSGSVYRYNNYRYYGRSVRPVL
ncbi:MAG: hypothetical protein ACI392_02815 [Paludibacteraceae bacterium]